MPPKIHTRAFYSAIITFILFYSYSDSFPEYFVLSLSTSPNLTSKAEEGIYSNTNSENNVINQRISPENHLREIVSGSQQNITNNTDSENSVKISQTNSSSSNNISGPGSSETKYAEPYSSSSKTNESSENSVKSRRESNSSTSDYRLNSENSETHRESNSESTDTISLKTKPVKPNFDDLSLNQSSSNQFLEASNSSGSSSGQPVTDVNDENTAASNQSVSGNNTISSSSTPDENPSNNSARNDTIISNSTSSSESSSQNSPESSKDKIKTSMYYVGISAICAVLISGFILIIVIKKSESEVHEGYNRL